jgi:hypothetical protein
MREDAGTKRVFVEKGVKNVEQVRDSSKSIISIMFCGCVDGTMLLPYVVYKAGNIYPAWGVGGPTRAPLLAGLTTLCTASGFIKCMCHMPVDWLERKSSLETTC